MLNSASSEQAQSTKLEAFTGYKYVKLSLKSCCSFVRLYRMLVWPRLAPSIPSALCFTTLGACQGGSVSNCQALLRRADHKQARPATLA